MSPARHTTGFAKSCLFALLVLAALASARRAAADGWVLTAFQPPPSRAFHSTIVDSSGNRILVYGGFRSTANPSGLNDLWGFDLLRRSWTQLAPLGTPPPANWLHAAVYDGFAKKMYVLGGQSALLWCMDLETLAWSQLSTSGPAPPMLTGHGMVLDYSQRRLIVFGGNFGNQLYVLDLQTLAWTHPATDATFPAPRSFHSFTMERQVRKAVLYGGFDGSIGYYNDCYELDLNTLAWSKQTIAGVPNEGRAGHGAAMDGQTQRLYIMGGHSVGASLNDIRAINLSSHAWETVNNDGTQVLPGEGAPAVMAKSHLCQFGGRRAGTIGETNLIHEYSVPDLAWVAQDSFPLERYDHVGIMDPSPLPGPRFIIFGGAHGPDRLGDTWWLDVPHDTWYRLNPPLSPPARAGACAALDSLGRAAYLFGGETGTTLLKDTWAFSLDSLTWRPVNVVTASPSKRQYAAAAIDPVLRRLWMFGGRSSTAALGDLWYFSTDSSRWVEVAAPGGPSARYLHSFVFNPWLRRMLLFGGSNDTTYLGDLWSFHVDSLTWRQEGWTGGSPGPRAGHSAFVDLNWKMGIYGGVTNYTNVPAGDTWFFNPHQHTWQPESFQPLNPLPRWRCAGTWDPINRGMEVFGGLAATGPMSDSWILLLLGGMADAPESQPAARIGLGPVSPNPSSGVVRFEVAAGREGPASVDVFDASGRRVATVWSGALGAARRSLSWDGRNARGERVGAGMYFLRLTLPGGGETRKLVRIR